MSPPVTRLRILPVPYPLGVLGGLATRSYKVRVGGQRYQAQPGETAKYLESGTYLLWVELGDGTQMAAGPITLDYKRV